MRLSLPISTSGSLMAIALLVALSSPAKAQMPGCNVVIYWNQNFDGEYWQINQAQYYIGDHWNDKTSSIKVLSGIWNFFDNKGFDGASMALHPGYYPNLGTFWNDRISSLQCVQPTFP